ncbi:MAG: hypothetical protein V7647_3900 [Acidobacteriota bacterium]|jgi:hypothetical protein
MATSKENVPHGRPRWHVLLLSLILVSGAGVVVPGQVQLDVCGCRNNPITLGNFDTADPATYPAGTTFPTINVMNIPLPADGVMVFSSMNLRERPQWFAYGLTINFLHNAANTPVTLLVSGNVTIGTRVVVNVSGEQAANGSVNALGKGGLGGPGGFRGGDGAYMLVNFANLGGTGLGPGGGAGGFDSYRANGHGAGATFLGAPDLLPLVGGSGGGGGASTAISPGCAGGGGGGGGGALLMAANGTITVDGQIVADGAASGVMGSADCASSGGGGSGGAVRLLATTIAGGGQVYARPGSGQYSQLLAQAGSIRLEALNIDLTVGQTTPLATRAAGPGPIVNPITPTVAITTVGGQTVPSPPSGSTGAIDLVLSAPGQTAVGLTTSGVPSGTTVDVTVKPRVGGAPVKTPVTLSNCDANGTCLASATFDLAAGAYFVEARATFTRP